MLWYFPAPRHHISHVSETTNHSIAKGELKMFASSILCILEITKQKQLGGRRGKK